MSAGLIDRLMDVVVATEFDEPHEEFVIDLPRERAAVPDDRVIPAAELANSALKSSMETEGIKRYLGWPAIRKL
jgi:hypothetical protein